MIEIMAMSKHGIIYENFQKIKFQLLIIKQK